MTNLIFAFDRATLIVEQPDATGAASLTLVDDEGPQLLRISNAQRAVLVELLQIGMVHRAGSLHGQEIEAARRIYAAALGTPAEDAARRNLVAVIERIKGIRLAS